MEKRVRLKKILNLLFYCVDMDFCSYKMGDNQIFLFSLEIFI